MIEWRSSKINNIDGMGKSGSIRAIGEVAFDKGIKAEQIKNWSDMATNT